MKILLTGGAGYIGSVVLRQLLEKKHLVYCLDILKFGRDSINSINDPNFKFFQIDINQIDEFNYFLNNNKFDAVIHLAAIVGDPACKLYSEEAYQTNWTSTKNLIDQCIITKVEKFIFASTCSNYGKMYDSNEILNENADLKPLSLYAELKVKCEEYYKGAVIALYQADLVRTQEILESEDKLAEMKARNDAREEEIRNRQSVKKNSRNRMGYTCTLHL